jgi:hypothetical protein
VRHYSDFVISLALQVTYGARGDVFGIGGELVSAKSAPSSPARGRDHHYGR